MIIDNKTSCKNVCAIQAIKALVPDRMASGRLISAMMANPYAHHIVPTMFVILTASQLLKPWLFAGCRCSLRFSMCA